MRQDIGLLCLGHEFKKIVANQLVLALAKMSAVGVVDKS
jgi:hypothetical protein